MSSIREKREKRKAQYASARKAAESRSSNDFTSILIPDGMTIFKPRGGMKYSLDFLPYRVGEGNPQAEPGMMYYERTYWVHRGIGPNSETHICLAKTMKKPCPICRSLEKMKSDPESDRSIRTALYPKQRQLFLVLDHANRQLGPQLFDSSYHCFGRQLDDEIGNSEPDDGYENFFHRKGGMTLKCSFKEESAGGYKYVSVASIHFRPREPLSQELLQGLPCLDKLLRPMDYNSLQKLFLQTSGGIEDDADDDENRRNSNDDADEAEAEADRIDDAADDDDDSDSHF